MAGSLEGGSFNEASSRRVAGLPNEGVKASIPCVSQVNLHQVDLCTGRARLWTASTGATGWSTFFVDADRTCYRGSSLMGPIKDCKHHRWTVDNGAASVGFVATCVFWTFQGALSSGASGGSKRHKQGSCRIGQRKGPLFACCCVLLPWHALVSLLQNIGHAQANS